MASIKPDPFLLGEWDGCLWRGFEREPQPRHPVHGGPQPSHGGNHGNLSKMRVQGPALPLGKGKEKQQSAHQGLVQDLAPLPPWLKPDRRTGQKKNKVRTLVNCTFFPPSFSSPTLLLFFFSLFSSFPFFCCLCRKVRPLQKGREGAGWVGKEVYFTALSLLDLMRANKNS